MAWECSCDSPVRDAWVPSTDREAEVMNRADTMLDAMFQRCEGRDDIRVVFITPEQKDGLLRGVGANGDDEHEFSPAFTRFGTIGGKIVHVIPGDLPDPGWSDGLDLRDIVL